MGRILVLGASILQLPVIRKSRELGHYVAVADYNPEAIGIKYADEYFNASTVDIESVCEAARKFRPDGIITIATDMPVRAMAVAINRMGLPGISVETAVKATDKGEMIKAFRENSVEAPWFMLIERKTDIKGLANQLQYPCILKPTDNAGSRGVILVRDKDKLESSYQYSLKNSPGGTVIAEEFMEGNEVSVEVVVVNGRVNILAVTDKLTTGPPYFVEMGHSQQSQLKKSDNEKIKDLAVRAVKAIGILHGPAHVEIMLTPSGPKMVELGARLGGDSIATQLVPLSTGVDMVRAAIDIALGQEPDLKVMYSKGSAIRYFNVREGVIRSIYGVEEAKSVKGVKECTFTKTAGDTVTSVQCSTDRVGSVIAQGEDAADAVRICELAAGKIKIITD